MPVKFHSAAIAALLLLAITAHAQPTAFTYQGQLSNGTNPATGAYDFRFQLYNAGNSVVAGPLTNAPVGVTNGLFLVTLDFGGPVFDGTSRTLEIGVRSFGDTNTYTILSPRQPILSVPYSIQSLNASNAVTLSAPLQGTNITGTIPDTKLSANVALLNGNQVFTGANSFSGAVTANNFSNVFTGAFSGNGFGQTNLSTTNLIGTLPDARLSTNVALLNSNATFSASVNATNFNGSFTGNGGGLTNIPATSLTGMLPDARLSANVALLNASQTFGGSNAFTGAVTANNATNNFTGAFAGSGHGLTNVPGAFFWVTVPGTNITANPNTGYITTNNVIPTVITLPLVPSIGDVYKVAGVGAAGWIIAQTNGQTILSGNLAPDAIGENWTPRDSSRTWTAVASSSDGVNLVATVNTGKLIYTSTNSGSNWVAQTGASSSQIWSCVASSADGSKLVAGVGDIVSTSGKIYVSSNFGASWNAEDSARQWVSVASSSDGTKLVAAVYGLSGSNVGVYVSSDTGADWSDKLPVLSCSAVASSANGTKLVATVSSGVSQGIWTSTNSGANWLQRTNSAGWNAVASSSDGSRLAATTGSGQLYISTDSGATWSPATTSSATWTAVTSSADGSRLAATFNGPGYILISTAGGATFTQHAPQLAWSGIASSADGSKLVAVANNGQIYTSSQSSTTTGATGYLTGSGQTAIELEYVGNGIFMPLSHEGTIRAY